jgi:hypothetical protein
MSALKVTRRFFLTLIGVGLVGCTPSGVAEQTIKRALPETIGPADHYEVQIEGLKARSGEADRVLIIGQRVRPQGTPTLDRLTIELRGVQYNRTARRLERLAGVEGTAQITAVDLADFLETQPNVQTATVSLRSPDQAILSIQPAFSLISLDLSVGLTVDATGRLMGERDRIYFVVSEVRAAGASLGDGAARLLSQAINPLVDLSGLPIDVEVTAISVENNTVQIEVTGDPTTAVGIVSYFFEPLN